jgi:DNA-binding NtrC family response regulator
MSTKEKERAMSARVLIVDDEALFREDLAGLLRLRGFECHTAANAEDGLARFQEVEPEAVLCDIKMPGSNGIEALDKMMQLNPAINVIMMTAFGDLETALEAFRKGACDYIMKPIVVEDVLSKLQRLIELRQLTQEVRYLRRQLSMADDVVSLPIVGKSEPMQRVFQLINNVAPTRSTVLISGESGTGKEIAARAIHDSSPAKDHPFVPINCAGIPESLLESELFGHMRGAFTGAVSDRVGHFELAGQGTLLLDEISEMPFALQSKLLRVLESREFLRVGGSKPKPLHARIITATNRDLRELVRQGLFREDLYFRVAVFEIMLPPLRERRTDIPLLITHFIRKLNSELKRRCLDVDPDALRALLSYSWPGNVRELRNAIERAMIINRGEFITLNDLPDSIAGASTLPADPPNDLRSVVRAFEREYIRHTLVESDGNKEEAARRLNINPSTLYRKMTELGVARHDAPDDTP